jgi:hypothetical protein
MQRRQRADTSPPCTLHPSPHPPPTGQAGRVPQALRRRHRPEGPDDPGLHAGQRRHHPGAGAQGGWAIVGWLVQRLVFAAVRGRVSWLSALQLTNLSQQQLRSAQHPPTFPNPHTTPHHTPPHPHPHPPSPSPSSPHPTASASSRSLGPATACCAPPRSSSTRSRRTTSLAPTWTSRCSWPRRRWGGGIVND